MVISKQVNKYSGVPNKNVVPKNRAEYLYCKRKYCFVVILKMATNLMGRIENSSHKHCNLVDILGAVCLMTRFHSVFSHANW